MKSKVASSVATRANPKLAALRRARVGVDEPSNLTDRAYSVVRRLILQRELTGGEVLVEGRLAERLEMSRTPLREALLRLEGEGLLVRANARSYAVRRITASHYFQCLQVRERLEAQAVSLAMGRVPVADVQRLRDSILALDSTQQGSSHWQADDQIHGLFARASGNEMLAETIAHLRVLCRLFEVVDPFNRIEEDRTEHLAILDAYEARDDARAEQAVVAHLRNLGRYTMSRLSNGMVSDFAA
ncbi:GntR family transcriptional regulator [Variovorax sp. J22G21]|uniref:GntR family transcriptional regulator n=1 Tax=Variovorax fucosicus TaxID=3053517 RepID=UPI002578D067|nr:MULTISPECIES: GntR family transcriptional regulator [unclassified Variovorax]MDM0040642.1 GntR family transcriptional regulator [Variovorax sp. J22R193]MDM0062015.1 GntR family transcriptional regulator [Variovorax sp. J22G21]